MKAILSRLRRSEFIRNTAIVASGTTIAQAITVLTAPVLTRVYHPTDYDTLGLYMMITGLIGTLATLQYHNVIITSASREESETALKFSIYLSGWVSLITLVLAIVLFSWIPGWFHSDTLKYWLLVAPLSIFFTGWNVAFGSLAIREKKFRLLTTNRIITAVFVPVVSITLGLLIRGPLGLLIGLITSQIIPSLMLSHHFLRTGVFRLNIELPKFKEVGRKYINFFKFTLPSEFVNNFINQLPVIMLGTSYTYSGAIGNFNLSNRMLGMPIQLITTSVLDVFRQRSSQEYNEKGNCIRVFNQTFTLLFFSGILPFALLMLIGPWIFSTVFGQNWEMAGNFARIMAPFFFLKFLVGPLSYVFFVAGKQKEDLIGHIAMIVLVILAFTISRIFSDNFLHALIAYSIAYSIIYLYYLVRSYQFSKGKNVHQPGRKDLL